MVSAYQPAFHESAAFIENRRAGDACRVLDSSELVDAASGSQAEMTANEFLSFR
jgi:hypothetical protein